MIKINNNKLVESKKEFNLFYKLSTSVTKTGILKNKNLFFLNYRILCGLRREQQIIDSLKLENTKLSLQESFGDSKTR